MAKTEGFFPLEYLGFWHSPHSDLPQTPSLCSRWLSKGGAGQPGIPACSGMHRHPHRASFTSARCWIYLGTGIQENSSSVGEAEDVRCQMGIPSFSPS